MMLEERESDEQLRDKRRAYLCSQMEAEVILESVRQRRWFAELLEDDMERVEEMLPRVEAVARALGHDFTMKVEPGEGWAYNLETNTVTVPVKELLTSSPEKIVALAIHEAGHRRLSRVVARSHYRWESRRLLLNGVEDPRVNNWMIREYEGVEKHYLDPLYEDLYPRDTRSPLLKGFRLNLPHVQFIYGLIHRWAHDEDHPAIKRREVLDTLCSAWAAVERAYTTLPESSTPNEREIWEAAKATTEIVMKEVWPLYEKLVEESKRLVEQGLRDGTIQLGEQGLPPGLSPEELSEKARQLVEEVSGEIADVLGGKVSRPDLEDAEEERRRRRRRGWVEIGPPGGSEVGPRGEEIGPLGGGEGPEGEGEAVGPLVGVGKAKRAREPGEVLGQWAKERSEEAQRLEEYKASIRTPYSKYLDEVAPQVEELAGFLEAIFDPNAAPKKEGFFKTGTSIHIRRLAQRKASGSLERDVFMRRTRPTVRDYRFSLLLDESGSMRDSRKDFNAICATVLFMEVLERLKIPFEVAGFHSTHLVHKEYGKDLAAADKDHVIGEIETSMGNGDTHDVEAVHLALDRMAKEAGQEKYVLVVTDGEGNGPGKMPEAIERASREGVRLIGIGVGQGVDHVEKQYEDYVLVHRTRDLAAAVGQKIEELILTS